MESITEKPSAFSALLFDTFDSGILIENSSRIILFANKKFKQIFGLPEEFDITGSSCMEAARASKTFFKNPDKFEQDINLIPIADEPVEEIVEASDGRFFKRKFASVVSEDKKKSLIWSYEDVTALINKGIELEKQRSFYHTVLNEIPADIAIFSPEHKYIYLNKTAIKNDEIREWIIGKDDYDYCDFRNLDRAIADNRRAHFTKAIDTGKSDMWVDKRLTPEGKDNYVLRIFYPYLNSNNDLEFVIGYGVNITQQKEQELAAELQRSRFKTLIDSLKEGVFQITFDGKMLFYNDAFLEVMNINGSVIGLEYTNNIMQNVHQEDKKQLYTSFEILKKTKAPQKGIFRRINSLNETTSFIDYAIWHIYDDTIGDIAIGRLSDITERVVNENNMLKLIEKEKELNSQQSNFIHITSHELRTPLSVIMSSAEILEMYEHMDKSNSETLTKIDKKGFTSGIVKEVGKITDILNEILVVGKIENNKVKVTPEKVNISEFIDELVSEFYAPYADGRTLVLNNYCKGLTCYFDVRLMRHALTNLLNNAFKYSLGFDEPLMSVYIKGNMLLIEVTDHGIGIPDFEREKIFSSFYRASNVGNISGSGIGLMLVDYVVRAHKGQVTVYSELNKGSRFTIKLPFNN